MQTFTALDPPALRAARERGDYVWLDLSEPSPEDLATLAEVFELHPAAVEDSHEWDQIAKLDDYGSHLTLVYFSACRVPDPNRIGEAMEIHLHISGDWAVTVRRGKCGLDDLHERLRTEQPECEDEVLYHILDTLTDGWDPVVGALDDRVDEVEANVLERPQARDLSDIYRLKQSVNDLLHDAGPQRELIRNAVEAMHAMPGLTRGSREWLRDVVTHVDSVVADLRRIAGDLRALTDTFFNANANRLNRVATLVAVVVMFFSVWTLVTGFFGQNFGWLVDSVDTKRDFLIFGLGGLIVPTVILVAVLWWRRRDWWQ